jgi:hypothetical protein
VVGGRATHHNSSFQVFPGAGGGTRLVWVTDVLPDSAATVIGAMVEEGSRVIKTTLG